MSAQVKREVDLADPFILEENGTYYMYGTGSDKGIPVMVSKDLKTWKRPEGSGIALHKKDSYGEKWFWAPEVYKVGDRYMMYYSAQEHICAAFADSPVGPFVQEEKKPILEDNGIDNSLYIDKDGKAYIFWVRFNHGNEIWMAQLDKSLAKIVPGTETFCIKMSQDWEKIWPAVNEGPFILKHKGVYYLTYSANSYECPEYGIGYATSKSVNGPWVKYEGNPILCKTGGLEGVGHHAFFKDADGKLKIVFHSHKRPGKIHPRKAHISDVTFKKAGKKQPDILTISAAFSTPEFVQE